MNAFQATVIEFNGNANGLYHPALHPDHLDLKYCSCGSVVEHCLSSAKVVGSIPREHTHTDKKMYSLNAL